MLKRTSFFTDVKADFVLPLKDQKAKENTSVEFDCTLTISTNDVHWFLNDVELHPTENVEIIKEGTKHKLILKNVSPQQTGQVTVSVGEKSSTATLIVEGLFMSLVFTLFSALLCIHFFTI